MFQNAGEKGDKHDDISDPPRRRGNKRRGHGTYANDRLSIVGVKVVSCNIYIKTRSKHKLLT